MGAGSIPGPSVPNLGCKVGECRALGVGVLVVPSVLVLVVPVPISGFGRCAPCAVFSEQQDTRDKSKKFQGLVTRVSRPKRTED